MILPTLEDTIRFRGSTFDVGHNNSGGSRVDQCRFGAMFVPNFVIYGQVRESSGDNQA
jgi:hypothetical protein